MRESGQAVIVYRVFLTIIFIEVIQAHTRSFKQHQFGIFTHIEVINLKFLWGS